MNKIIRDVEMPGTLRRTSEMPALRSSLSALRSGIKHHSAYLTFCPSNTLSRCDKGFVPDAIEYIEDIPIFCKFRPPGIIGQQAEDLGFDLRQRDGRSACGVDTFEKLGLG